MNVLAAQADARAVAAAAVRSPSKRDLAPTELRLPEHAHAHHPGVHVDHRRELHETRARSLMQDDAAGRYQRPLPSNRRPLGPRGHEPDGGENAAALFRGYTQRLATIAVGVSARGSVEGEATCSSSDVDDAFIFFREVFGDRRDERVGVAQTSSTTRRTPCKHRWRRRRRPRPRRRRTPYPRREARAGDRDDRLPSRPVSHRPMSHRP